MAVPVFSFWRGSGTCVRVCASCDINTAYVGTVGLIFLVGCFLCVLSSSSDNMHRMSGCWDGKGEDDVISHLTQVMVAQESMRKAGYSVQPEEELLR